MWYSMNRQACNLITPEKDAPAGGLKSTCEQIEEGGFSCAVWTYDWVNGPLFDWKADIQDSR